MTATCSSKSRTAAAVWRSSRIRTKTVTGSPKATWSTMAV